MPHFGGRLAIRPCHRGLPNHLRMTPTANKGSGSRSNGTERLPRLFPSCVANQTRVRRPPKTMAAKTRLAGGETGKDISAGPFARELTSMSRPRVDVFASLILGVTVPPFELVALAINGGQIIVRQFRPLLFDLAFDLFPIPFNTVPVHGDILRVTRMRQRLNRRQVPSPRAQCCPVIDPVGTKADASD